MSDAIFGPLFVHHSETSREAAESIKPSSATLRLKVLAWFRAHGPATDEACALGLGMPGNTQRPRRLELVTMGKLRKLDDDGVTASGRRASRWVVAEGRVP